jgi:hypothetical protein
MIEVSKGLKFHNVSTRRKSINDPGNALNRI